MRGDRRSLKRRWSRGLGAGAAALGAIGSLIAIGQLGAGALESSQRVPAGVEEKQIVGFHQVTNRICTENRQALERALPEAHSRVQLLAFLSRGVGWGINDLEGVIAPPSLAGTFAEEISLRQKLQSDLLELQRAGETGDLESREKVGATILGAERWATEIDRELGLRRCAPVLPTKVRRAAGIA